jgi:recombinational DNA repair protein RecR
VSAIDDLVTELARLPTIGRKSALRLTYHLLKQPPEQSRRLADALRTLAEQVHPARSASTSPKRHDVLSAPTPGVTARWCASLRRHRTSP